MHIAMYRSLLCISSKLALIPASVENSDWQSDVTASIRVGSLTNKPFITVSTKNVEFIFLIPDVFQLVY